MPEEFTDPQRPHHRERHMRTPTDELTHQQRLERQRLHIRVLSLVLVLVLLMLAYTAAFDLDSAPEWIVLGGICATAVGAVIAIQSR
jgi:membrane protein YdbS with pleckstrin-like domain